MGRTADIAEQPGVDEDSLLENNGESMKLREPTLTGLVVVGLILFQLLWLSNDGFAEEKVSFAVLGDISLWNSAVMSVIDEINDADPDFVVILGDYSRVAGSLSADEYIRTVKTVKERITSHFNMSAYVVAGNHEVSAQKHPEYYSLWEEAYGPFYHLFDVGSSSLYHP